MRILARWGLQWVSVLGRASRSSMGSQLGHRSAWEESHLAAISRALQCQLTMRACALLDIVLSDFFSN